jgi:hypothetical protein
MSNELRSVDRIVLASARRVSAHRRKNICQDARTKLPSRAFPNPTPIGVSARTQLFLGERIFREGIETHESERRRTIHVCAQQRKLRGTSIATRRRLTPNVCLPTPSLPSPAPEILDYLVRHPEAQDTIDGILHWWVLDACIRKWAPKIAETVAQLVEQGFLEQSQSADGNVFYRASPNCLATLQQQPPQNCTPNATP